MISDHTTGFISNGGVRHSKGQYKKCCSVIYSIYKSKYQPMWFNINITSSVILPSIYMAVSIHSPLYLSPPPLHLILLTHITPVFINRMLLINVPLPPLT